MGACHARADDLPDGVVLLQAARQARQNIKTGDVTATFRHTYYKWGKPSEGVVESQFLFEGDKRTVEERQWTYSFVRHGAEGKDDSERIEAEQLDSEQAVVRGLLSKRFEAMRSAFDGARLCQFTTDSADTLNSACYCNYKKGRPSNAFDPRLFGLTHSYRTSNALADALPTRGYTPSIVRDSIAGQSVCHVTLTGTNGLARHVWVGDVAPFRVYKIQWAAKVPPVEVVIESEYDHGVQHPLPTRVRTQYKEDGKLIDSADVKLTKVVLDSPVDSSVGTIRSLKIPVGRRVDDEVARTQLGYWNGTDISPDLDSALAAARKGGIPFTPPVPDTTSEDVFRPTPVRPSRTWTPWVWAIGALAIAALAVALRYRRRT